MASLTSEEYWHEQRRLARIEEKLDRALEENRRLELGLAEQGHVAMELRAQVQRLEAAFATIVARTKEESPTPTSTASTVSTVSTDSTNDRRKP
jgi:hypothetical protein